MGRLCYPLSSGYKDSSPERRVCGWLEAKLGGGAGGLRLMQQDAESRVGRDQDNRGGGDSKVWGGEGAEQEKRLPTTLRSRLP